MVFYVSQSALSGFDKMCEECVFCRIAKSEIKVHEVYLDEDLVAFLDIGPIRPGHIQIIPIQHYDYFDDLPSDIAHRIIDLGQKIARRQKSLFNVKRVALLFTGGDIAHAHCHLVPVVEETDITSARYIVEKNLTYKSLPHPGDAELAKIAISLSKEFEVVLG